MVSGDLSLEPASGLTVDVKRGLDMATGDGRRLVAGDGSARLRFRSNEAYFGFATGVRPPAVSRSLANGGAWDHPRRVIGELLVRLGHAIGCPMRDDRREEVPVTAGGYSESSIGTRTPRSRATSIARS